MAKQKMLPRPTMKKEKQATSDDTIRIETTSEEFVAKHQKLTEEDHSGGSHSGTEMGWLVSYADMMTLLFGLFVLLYVLKSDKTKDADETMRQISNKFFSYQAPRSSLKKNDVVSPPENTTEKITLEKLESEKVELKTQIQKIAEEKNKSEVQMADQKKALQEQQEKIETLKEKISALSSEQKKKEREIASAAEVSMTKLNEKFNNELEQVKAELERVKNELEQAKNQNAELMSKQITQQNYVTTLVTWDTEKHDLDLEIYYDKNKVFNFKRRKIDGLPGNFEIDSRFGPGIEMWKAENYKPGKYIARIVLFNKNGNIHPAKVKLTIFSQSDIYKSEEFQIKSVGIPKLIPFTIDEKGKIQVLQ